MRFIKLVYKKHVYHQLFDSLSIINAIELFAKEGISLDNIVTMKIKI